MIRPALLLPFALLLAAPAHAADKYQFDKDHTHIFFHVSHEGFSQMWGRIKEFDGYFTFSAKEPEKSEVDITMKSASVDTDVPALNKALQGEKFFNVTKFPAIHFVSTGITHVHDLREDARAGNAEAPYGGDAYVTGNLTLLGVTRPIVLHVIYNRSGIHPYTNNYVSGFSVDGAFKRSDFGMNAYLPNDVGDVVTLHAEVEGTDALKHPGNVKTPH